MLGREAHDDRDTTARAAPRTGPASPAAATRGAFLRRQRSLHVQDERFAIASLVLGIIPCTGITSILAIVCGFIARNQIQQSRRTQQGGGMALAGIILGFVWIGISVIYWIAVIAS